MAAFVTDQFRILNASNFIDSVSDTNNSYYAFLGLPNPTSPSVGFGRTTDWDTNTPNPVDNFQYLSHYRDTSLFGKKLSESNVVRVVRKINWTLNNSYDMYRHDYGTYNQAPVSKAYRLYDANYYVITSAFRVYICIGNGSSGNIDGTTTSPLKSTVEPSQTTPGRFETADGYEWLYLFTITPADIIKFDSTEYIPVPNNWDTNIENQPVYEAGDNGEQIKKVYIENGGSGYSDQPSVPILGDGSGGTVQIVTTNGSISEVIINNGGSEYTYGIVDLSSGSGTGAKLIPIIPPSTGHGRDIYQELGTDKVLLYSRFDDSDRDFPITTQFSQIGIIKNPQEYSNTSVYTRNTFSSLSSAVLTDSIVVNPGDEISQDQGGGVVAKGYIASFDSDTKVLKYFQDRSLVFGNKFDQTADTNTNNLAPFISTQNISYGGGSATIDTSVDGTSIITTGDGKLIDAGVTFTQGLADPEINKKTGEILYIDNRPVVERDSSQKEDIKIILEF